MAVEHKMHILKSNLGRRIMLLVLVSMLLILLALGISGWLAVRQSANRVSHERQALAQAASRYLEYVLRQNLSRLENVRFTPGVDIEDRNLSPEKSALHTAYLGSIFDGGVFLADQQGTPIWIEPQRLDFLGADIAAYPLVRQSIDTGRPVVSNVFLLEPASKPTVFMVTPLRNIEGKIVGVVGGEINPAQLDLREVTQLAGLERNSYIDIVDGNGTVLTSSDRSRILQSNHQGDAETPVVSETATLSLAPWSVSIVQPEEEALAPVRQMEQRFVIFGLSSLVMAIFLSWGLTRSIVRPVRQLIGEAQIISRGDLSRPVAQSGSDEIGELSRSFDHMRVELRKSLEEIQQLNRDLEARVQDRTKLLEESYREIERKEAARGELLKKMLSAQEEERKRIARELHDETSQSLVALLMRLEAATAQPSGSAAKIDDRLKEVKTLAVRTIDNVHKIIFDLRPSVLDDLGLLSAIRWYAENRLGAKNVKIHVEVAGEERKLPPQIEAALFRVVQEAIANIAKHAEAENAVISVDFQDLSVNIEVEDDGRGFDIGALKKLRPDQGIGLGLLGMKERVTMMGGSFHIESSPDRGTRLSIQVPADYQG